MSGAPGSLPGVLRAFISHLHGAWASHPLPRVHNVTTSSICPPCDHAIHDPSTLATVFCSLPVLMPLGGFSSHPTGQWFTGRLQSADQDELIPGYRLSSPSTSRAGPSTNRRSQQCASRFNPTCPEPTQWHNCGYAIQYGGCDIRSGTKLYWRDITGVTLPIRAIEWPPKYVYQNVRAIHHLVSAREPWLSVQPWECTLKPKPSPPKTYPNLYPKPCVGFR